jgi:hypothetical protein
MSYRPSSRVLVAVFLIACGSLVVAERSASAKAPGQPAYKTEKWPRARRLVWAKPGQGGRFKDARNWREGSRTATKGPDRNTDIVLPRAAKRYKVEGAGFDNVRHVIIDKNAFLIGNHRREIRVWGNIHVKDGGYIYYICIRGPKHTFFRIDNAEFPNAKNRTQYRHTTRSRSRLNRTQISHKFQVCKYGDASVEFIGRFGVSDEIMVQHGRMILNGELRWSGVTNKGALEIYDGATLELQSGATIGPFIGENRKRVFNLNVYRNGVIQAGSPERPLTADAFVMLGFAANDRPGLTGLYAAKGSQVRVYSTNPAKARLVFTSITSRADYHDGHGKRIGDPTKKASGNKGITMQLAGDVALNGVMFDYVCKNGIKLADPAARKTWSNVAFGSHNAASGSDLFGRLTVDPNVYYHNRGDGKSEFGLTTTAVKDMEAFMKDVDKYRIAAKPSPIKVRKDGGFSKPLAVVFTEPMSVTLTTAVRGATIRYTLDGTEPTVASLKYTAPVRLTKTTRLKVKAFRTGMAPSKTFSAAYVFK